MVALNSREDYYALTKNLLEHSRLVEGEHTNLSNWYRIYFEKCLSKCYVQSLFAVEISFTANAVTAQKKKNKQTST